jgi:hypothetical protein
MFFRDLDLCRYNRGPLDADSWQVPLLAVGWLERQHEFSRGSVPPALLEKLRLLVAGAKAHYQQYHFRGLHECSLCPNDRVEGGLPDSYVNLLIPGAQVVFAAPAGIAHYMEAHSYLPPSEFIRAVDACPSYGTDEFIEALRISNRGILPPIESFEESIRSFSESLAAAPQLGKSRGEV